MDSDDYVYINGVAILTKYLKKKKKNENVLTLK